MKRIELQECDTCSGTGQVQWEDELEQCDNCDGLGELSANEVKHRMLEESGERMSDLEREEG